MDGVAVLAVDVEGVAVLVLPLEPNRPLLKFPIFFMRGGPFAEGVVCSMGDGTEGAIARRRQETRVGLMARDKLQEI